MTQITSTSRRGFLQGGVAGLALATAPFPVWSQAEPPPLEDYTAEFFTPAEWAFVLAATARLIPSDGDGPGALEARLPVFIDRQLAGGFGQAADWYMQGPHDPAASPDFGYQTPLTPAEIYRDSIVLFDDWCRARHGARFADLTASVQDGALAALQADAAQSGESLGPAGGEGETATEASGDGPASGTGDAAGSAASASATSRILPDALREFFALLLQNTKEGYFSDPRYGGNHGMAAWVHIGFPGARASFLEWVDRDNVPYRLGPVSIAGERA